MEDYVNKNIKNVKSAEDMLRPRRYANTQMIFLVSLLCEAIFICVHVAAKVFRASEDFPTFMIDNSH